MPKRHTRAGNGSDSLSFPLGVDEDDFFHLTLGFG